MPNYALQIPPPSVYIHRHSQAQQSHRVLSKLLRRPRPTRANAS
jgi:hypothetical protein